MHELSRRDALSSVLRTAAFRTAVLLLVLVSIAAGWAQTLVVAAASSLTEPIGELAARFEAHHPGVRVVTNLAGSSILARQILDGAPVDLFASADARQLEVVANAGLLEGEVVAFARNDLVVLARRDGPVTRIEQLASPGVLLVLGGPEVPVGAYARLVLADLEDRFGAGFARDVLANLASEEPNARLTAAKVMLGEADAAIVYRTDAIRALRSDARAALRILELPHDAQVPAEYAVAVTTNGFGTELARSFVSLLRSAEGRAVLSEHGFAPVR